MIIQKDQKAAEIVMSWSLLQRQPRWEMNSLSATFATGGEIDDMLFQSEYLKATARMEVYQEVMESQRNNTPQFIFSMYSQAVWVQTQMKLELQRNGLVPWSVAA